MLHMLLTILKPSWRRRRKRLLKTAVINGNCTCLDYLFAHGHEVKIPSWLQKNEGIMTCPSCGRSYGRQGNGALLLLEENTFTEIYHQN